MSVCQPRSTTITVASLPAGGSGHPAQPASNSAMGTIAKAMTPAMTMNTRIGRYSVSIGMCLFPVHQGSTA